MNGRNVRVIMNTSTPKRTCCGIERIAFVLLFLATMPSVHAQMAAVQMTSGIHRDQQRIDSLISALAVSKADTTRLWILNELVALEVPQRPDEMTDAGKHNERMGDLARTLIDQGNERTRSRVRAYLARYHCNAANLGEHSLSRQLQHALAAIDLLANNEDNTTLGEAYGIAFNQYLGINEEKKAFEFLQKRMRLVESSGDERSKMDCYASMAAVEAGRGDGAAAVEYIKKALRSAEILKDTTMISMYLGNLSSRYRLNGDMVQAREWADKAVAMGRSPGGFLYGPLVTRAMLFLEQKDYAAAERDVLELFQGQEQNTQLLNMLSRVYEGQGDLARATTMTERAYGIDTARKNAGNIMILAGRLAHLYRQQHRYKEALKMMDVKLQWRDSVDRIAEVKAVERAEFSKAMVADSVANQQAAAKAELAHHAEVAREKNRRNIILLSAVAVLLVALALWTRLRYVRRARKEADRLRQRAEASEKFKQQFLANMSHEIRTPMNAIMGMTGILKRNEQLPEQRKYLDAIAQSSENLLVILNDILDLSKLEAGKIDLEQVAFDPRQVIGNVRDILRFKAEEKGLEVEVRVDDNVPRALRGDPTRLNQIVLNLAGNAIKFTEHGSVTITAKWSDGALSIAVTDTGIGIPADRLDKIFEEFTQAYSDTTRKYGGTGLGLTISKRLAELQGGSIAVKSEKGKGSTFTVTIPYPVAQDDLVRADHDPPQRTELRGLRILLAEDNDFNAMVAQDELADAIPGVHVDIAANGRIAVEMVQANNYDAVLMDVQMPEMNGYDATTAIRALPGDKSRIRILAMTANVMKEEVERCLEAGMDGYIPKPFKREELIGGIVNAMSKGLNTA